MLYCIILYCIMIFHTVLYYTIRSIILYYTQVGEYLKSQLVPLEESA